jgi:hypothetical protein
MMARPLGTVDEVQRRLAELFPFVRWKRTSDGTGWSGLGTDPATERYVDVLLLEDTPATIHFVSLNKAAPSTMRLVMEALDLNHACAIEAGELVDPYAYQDGDRHYVKLREPTQK